MAKTFGTGSDPKGLVNRGVEGSGAAQIFRPSQAVQDFVTGQRQQGLQKQKQKQAEAKAKAERQKNLDNQFKDLLKIDIKGWTEPDNQRLLGQYGEIEKQAAELKAMGMNPFDDNDLTMKIAKFKLDMGALQDQKKLFELANTKAYTLATNKNITPEQFAEYEQNIKLYASKPFEERMLPENLALLDAPKVQEQIDPLIGLKRFESIYAKPKKTYKDRGDGTFELVEEYDLGDIRKNFDTVKNEKWFKTLEATNPNFVDNYLDAFQTKKNIKGTADKSSVNINSGQGSWGNKQYTGRVAKYNLGNAVSEAELLGISGTDAIDIFGLRNAQPNWAQDEINVIDYSYQDNIQPKPILANTPQIVAIDDLGQKVDITAFPKGTIKYIPNRVYETKQDGVYYTTGTASINVFDAKKGINEVKNINIGFIVDDSNKFDFENQWLPDGVNIENAMQKNFDIAKEKGQTKTSATQTATTKPATTTNKFDKYKRK